jgi:hypothetical protein
MLIHKAEKPGVKAVAELALIPGEGIPEWIRAQSAVPGQETTDVSATVSTAWIHDCRHTPG